MNLPTISSLVKELRLDYPKLTEFEALQLAVQMQRNEIMRRAFVVGSNDNYPSALEAIAATLGFRIDDGGAPTMYDLISGIDDSLEDMTGAVRSIARST
jgi:hypothetical protein